MSPYKVHVRSHGYRFVTHHKTKKAANRLARINRSGKKRADKGVHVWIAKVKK